LNADPVNFTQCCSLVKCVNLRDYFGDCLQIGYDPAFYAEHGERARTDDPWLQVIHCQHGEIYAQGGTRLVASSYRRGAIATRLLKLPCARVERDGDDGVDISIELADFTLVAELMRPRRRRMLSVAQRQALADAGRVHQFRSQPQHAAAKRAEPPAPETDRDSSDDVDAD
jgi:hypothetical protein